MPLVKVEFFGKNADVPVRGKPNDRGQNPCKLYCRVKCSAQSIACQFLGQCWSAGLCWALSRCLEVPVMHIWEAKAWQVSGAFEDIASKLLWVAAKNTALQVLIVDFFPKDLEDHQSPGTENIWEWFHALVEQLAACRPRLQALGCCARDLNTFPLFPNLKHLMLDLQFTPLHNGLGSLTTLKSLETLHLNGYIQRQQRSEPSPAFDCPPIQLSSLSRLLRLALEDIRPEGISVSSRCAVHVTLSESYIGSHPVWSAICIDELRSISWFCASSDVLIGTLQDIPRALREASCLDVDVRLIKQWSCGKLPSALARVRRLIIISEHMMLCVPAKVQWQSMYLSGWDHLEVTFEDVDAFVKVPMNFHFASRKPFGRSWLALDAAMVQNKPKWVSMTKQVKYRCECADERKCNCSNNDMHQLFMRSTLASLQKKRAAPVGHA